MIKQITDFNPEVLSLQNTTPTIKDDLHTAKLIKEKIPECKIIFQGLHGTVRPQDLLNEDSAVDIVIRHEPDLIIKELVNKYHNNENVFTVEGISYRKNGEIISNPDRELIKDLDILPFAARDLLEQDKYLIAKKGMPFTIIKVSRGCPFKCTYCTSNPYSKGFWRVRSPKSIVEEVEEIQTKYGINDFLFLSDTFNVKESWVLELTDRLKQLKQKPSWISNSRGDTISYKQAKAMKESGCWLVSIGVESGSEQVLKACKKGITTDRILKGVRYFQENNIKVIAYFMFGLPQETHDTMNETLKFLKNLNPDYAYFYAVTPFPGTEFYKQAKEEGWLNCDDWGSYFHGVSDVVSYPNLSSEEIQKMVKKAYRTFYLRPSFILKEIVDIITHPKVLMINIKTGIDLLKSFF